MTYETLLKAKEAIEQQEPIYKVIYILGATDFGSLYRLAKYYKVGDKIVSRIGRGKKYIVKYTIVAVPTIIDENTIMYGGIKMIKDKYCE